MKRTINAIMADLTEAMYERELDEPAADGVWGLIGELHNAAMERSLMLQRFIGMAQERTWPSLETINEARTLMGMEPIKETASV